MMFGPGRRATGAVKGRTRASPTRTKMWRVFARRRKKRNFVRTDPSS
jgi:hypothetical protein